MKYKVLVCREYWGTIEVEATDEAHARELVEEGEYDSKFIPNGKTGNIGVYTAEPVLPMTPEEDLIGKFIDENCPKCSSKLYGNKVGTKWCPRVGCDYRDPQDD